MRPILLLVLAGCDGLYVSDEEALAYYDRDGDGYPVSAAAAFGASEPFDCDDADETVHPDATERCNGVDDDCDGPADEDAPDAGLWYVDLDGDGEGAGEASIACTAPADHVSNDADCDDRNDAVHTAAAETCNDIDDDCDDEVDEDGSFVSWYPDADGDGFGAESGGVLACAAPAEGWRLVAGDCDDANEAIHPDADEIWYDGTDQDCDGASDDDQDGDGIDSSGHGGDDCDDTDPDVKPGATEIWYDGDDQNCDGASDFDQDVDGYDADAHGGADCDDLDVDVSPAALEVWYDGVDQDCDGASDDDQDRDGYDALAEGGDDCDDVVAAVNPGAEEVWYDGVDQDCDGGADYDQDGDGFDSDAYGGADCDDSSALALPTGTEVCNDGLDNDCDGTDNGCRLVGSLTLPTDADWTVGVGSPLDVSAGDTNGDGAADIAVRVNSTSVMVYAPPSTGPVVQLVDSGGIDAVTFRGDYDADGYADLVVARSGSTEDVWVLNGPVTNMSKLSAPDASYSSSTLWGIGSGLAAVGDLDGDGYEDLGVGENSEIHYALGPFSSTLTWIAPYASQGLCCNADRPIAPAGDFDNDGLGDVVTIAEDLSSNVFPVVFLPLGATTTRQLTIGDDFRLSDTVGDLDDDGWTDDVIVADATVDEAYVYFGPATGGTPALTISGAGDGVAVGDFDGDGMADVAAANEADGVYVFYGPFAAGTLDTSSADLVIAGSSIQSIVRSADVNGDGLDDVVIATSANVATIYGSGR